MLAFPLTPFHAVFPYPAYPDPVSWVAGQEPYWVARQKPYWRGPGRVLHCSLCPGSSSKWGLGSDCRRKNLEDAVQLFFFVMYPLPRRTWVLKGSLLGAAAPCVLATNPSISWTPFRELLLGYTCSWPAQSVCFYPQDCQRGVWRWGFLMLTT